MGKLTQVLVRSKDCTESGFPRKLSVYHIGEARMNGDSFRVDVMVLREHGVQFALSACSLPDRLSRGSSSDHYRRLAEEMKLDILVTDLEAC